MGLIFLTAIVVVTKYFQKYRAIACGITLSGCGTGAFVLRYLSTYLHTHPSTHPSTNPRTHLSAHPSARPSIHPSTHPASPPAGLPSALSFCRNEYIFFRCNSFYFGYLRTIFSLFDWPNSWMLYFRYLCGVLRTTSNCYPWRRYARKNPKYLDGGPVRHRLGYTDKKGRNLSVVNSIKNWKYIYLLYCHKEREKKRGLKCKKCVYIHQLFSLSIH